MVRGPQSAVYGSYANTGVINFVTRAAPESRPTLDVVAEGGTYQERRFGITGSGHAGGLGAFRRRLRASIPTARWPTATTATRTCC